MRISVKRRKQFFLARETSTLLNIDFGGYGGGYAQHKASCGRGRVDRAVLLCYNRRMDKEQYKKFHKKVRLLGIIMLCAMALTLVYLIVALSLHDEAPLLLLAGLPVFLSVDVSMLLLCYLFSRKDREYRTLLSDKEAVVGAGPLFGEILRDYRDNRLESVWDSVTPNGWKVQDVYDVEDKIELVLTQRAEKPCEITIQFGKREVTVFFDNGESEEYLSQELISDNFADIGSLVVWLAKVCQDFADKATNAK